VGMTKGKRPQGRKPIDPKRAQLLRKVLLHCAIAVIFLGGLGAGFYYLQDYVKREVADVAEPRTVVIRNRPHWMSDFLVEKIAMTARPTGVHSAFDKQMLTQARVALEKNPWIAKVHEVRRAYGRKPGDVLEIDCEYRVPVALVRWGAYYWLVDRNGFKLPEQYEPQDVPKMVRIEDGRVDIRIIDGVKRPPPETGHKWAGEDLAAALEMIRLLSDKPYAQEILKVDVARFGSDKEPQVVLITRYATEVRWGRVPSDKDAFIEVSTARKLDRLQSIYAHYGRLDAGHPGGIDIRFDAVTYPDPAANAATANNSR
jgi:cell division septal protein FtsQ